MHLFDCYVVPYAQCVECQMEVTEVCGECPAVICLACHEVSHDC